MPVWLPTLLASIAGGGVASYVGVRVALADIGTRLSAVEKEIGSKETGMRAQLHSQQNRLGKHAARLWRLEEKVGIPPWEDKE